MSAALYIHIPYCRHKCIYCDFYSITRTKSMADFTAALMGEMELHRNRKPFSERLFSTLYFGGGTPSLLPIELLEQILAGIRRSFVLTDDAEITLEANPGALLRENLPRYKALGFNRLSIGVQSFVDSELTFLSRIHRAAESERCFHQARACGFDNISLDLIFGIPGQTRAQLDDSLRRALALRPEHLSCYGLTFEPNTPLGDMLQKQQVRKCSQEIERSFYLEICSQLYSAGYQHYEISNFALPGRASRHNRKYWDFTPYLGLGPSAHSFDGRRRWGNVRDLDAYISALAHRRMPPRESERMNANIRMNEWIMLGLRQREGIDLSAWRKMFRADFLTAFARPLSTIGDWDEVEPFTTSRSGKLLTVYDAHLSLTLEGLLLYDTICAMLFQS